MKLIIDISEEQYNDIVKHLTDNDGNYAYSDFNLREIIRSGTPYNPSGDLISRSDLKDKMKKAEEQADTFEMLVEFYEQIIDNAQAVEPERPQCNQIAWEQGYEAGLAQGKAEIRPQGTWTFDEKGNFHCDKCGREPHDQYATTPYCPNCGADMRGGAE